MIDNKSDPVLHEIIAITKAMDFALILGTSGSGKTILWKKSILCSYLTLFQSLLPI